MKTTKVLSLCFLLSSYVFLQVFAAPNHGKALKYLKNFGYIVSTRSNNENLQSQESLVEAVREFQQFAGLPVTGELNRETLHKMTQKRCGNMDIVGTARARRYTLHGSKWLKKHLTYKITSYTDDLSPSQISAEIAAAFKWWSDISELKFTRVHRSTQADIEIRFASGNHGDRDPFDGKGQTLAHAFFPNSGGDAHFDDDETWLLKPSRSGVSLRIVAAHEFGHSLGLSHSDSHSALMAPFYNPASTGLESDDVDAIQRLYGSNYEKPSVFSTTTRRSFTTPPSITTTTQPTNTKTCTKKFDAITQAWNGKTYAFYGEQFWRLNNDGIDDGYPQSIKEVWGISGKIDAALSYSYYIDLFKGNLVYRYAYGQKMLGYPRLISSVYKGIPGDVDAAFQWSGNGKLYFIKGNKYWRYNKVERRVDPNYPRPMSIWKGLPSHIDAALQWRSKTYFFSDGLYYRFDDSTIGVAQLKEKPYPRRADRWWLGCSDNSNQLNQVDSEAGDNTRNNSVKVNFSCFLLILLSTLVWFTTREVLS